MSRSSSGPVALATTRVGIATVGVLLVSGALLYRWVFATSPADNGLLLVVPAFLAGLLSFLSPCTLPILPTYFAWTLRARRERIVPMTVAFFLGLATTMVVLGATASALSQLVFAYRHQLAIVGGLVIVGFGVMSMAGQGFGGVVAQRRPSAGIAGSFAYGATFALGWTSCVGPILGALLTMLATQGGTVLQGATLAFVYALGLGSPLIVVASMLAERDTQGRTWRILRGCGWTVRIGRREIALHSTNLLSGALLVVTGATLASGQLATWSQWALQTPLTAWLLRLEDGIRWLFVGA